MKNHPFWVFFTTIFEFLPPNLKKPIAMTMSSFSLLDTPKLWWCHGSNGLKQPTLVRQIVCSEVYETLRESGGTRAVLDDMQAQFALGVWCISQAVYMLRTNEVIQNNTRWCEYLHWPTAQVSQDMPNRMTWTFLPRTCAHGLVAEAVKQADSGWNLLRFNGFNSRIWFCTNGFSGVCHAIWNNRTIPGFRFRL